MKLPYIAVVAVFAAIVAGCGGGGGGSSVLPAPASGGANSVTPVTTPAATAPTSAAPQTITLSIVIPKGVTTAQMLRGKQYIPSNTGSMTLTLVSVNGVVTSGTAQGPFNLTAPSQTNVNPACTVVSNGTACTFTIIAPSGTDIFTATTFSDANATVPLGSGSVAFNVASNGRNTANLTLAGPVASVSLLSATTSLNNGNPMSVAVSRDAMSTARVTTGGTRLPLDSVTPAPLPSAVTSSRIFVIALDAVGNQIINPTTFDIPVTITLSLNGASPNVVSLNVNVRRTVDDRYRDGLDLR